MSKEVGVLAVSLFVAGYCVGYVSQFRVRNNLIFLFKTDIMGASFRTVWPKANFLDFLPRLYGKSRGR